MRSRREATSRKFSISVVFVNLILRRVVVVQPKQSVKSFAGKTAVLPDTALQFERVLGDVKASLWLGWEADYQLYVAREREREGFQAGKDWAQCFPIKEMVNKKYISAARANRWTWWIRSSEIFRGELGGRLEGILGGACGCCWVRALRKIQCRQACRRGVVASRRC